MTRFTDAESNKWKMENISLLSWLLSQENPHEFLADMKRTVVKYGALTPKQTAAVAKWHYTSVQREKIQQAEAEKLEGAPALTEGKREIEGEIVSTKWHDSQYGTTPKMVVRLDDGNKLWGTIPAEIEDKAEGDLETLVGLRIFIVATVKVSDRDPHFGFFSRPRNGKLL